MQPGRAFPWSALAKEVAVSTGSDEEFDGFMRGRGPAMVRLAYQSANPLSARPPGPLA